jgi:hypothetical protein
MNNKNFIEMAKKTVFTGVINGEMFDNVQAYNARMNELVAAGIEDICASSSTEIKFEEDPTNEYTTTTTQDVAAPVDEDLTIYPYMCEDDPFYLDLLVTNDPVKNQEAYNEAQKVLEKCYRYTGEVMGECCNCERKEYLEDVTEIIENIDADIADTIRAMDSVNAKKKRAEEEYHDEINKLNKELDLLAAADKVAGMFKAYYEDVQNEMLTMINADKNKNCNCKSYHCCNTNTPEVTTSVAEKEPQTEWDFNRLLDVIFGDGVIRTRLK